RFKEKNEEARVHFIPYLKEGVFVTLCAPVVIKIPHGGRFHKKIIEKNNTKMYICITELIRK
ncbi:hypothetical protein, partial [Methanosarcina mazei]|uniref:hypothetical protein n=1 Tax=Methanosarcina mazei TaxID=2209 RepID=UPI00064E72BE